MKKIILYLLGVMFLSCSCLGCLPLVLGGAAGALGAVVVTKDTIQGETDRSYDSLWSAAIRVSRIRGTIKNQDNLKGTIELEVESGRIWISLIRLTRATTRLKISARKYHLPDLGLAQEIFVKIMDEAR